MHLNNPPGQVGSRHYHRGYRRLYFLGRLPYSLASRELTLHRRMPVLQEA